MLAYEDPGKVYRDKRKQIKQAIKSSRSPDAFRHLQQHVLQDLSDEQQEILRRADYALPCQPGCSYCCHLRVEAFAHEILILHAAIAALSDPARRRTIEDRVRSAAQHIAAIGEEEHVVTNIPCGLLTEDRCGFHGMRPLACARYHSTELSACRRAHDDPVGHGDRRPILPEINLQGDVAIQAMTDALKQARLDHRSYELNTTLAQLFEDPALALRWRQGRPLLPAGRKTSPSGE